MKKTYAIFGLILSLLLPACAEASTPLKACPKSQLNKTKNGFICKKTEGFYRWVKINTPVTIETLKPSPTPTPTITSTPQPKIEIASTSKKYFNSPCDLDPGTPLEWKDFERKHINGGGCLSALRVPTTQTLTELPKTQTDKSNLNLSQCKIEQSRNKGNVLGFKTWDSYWQTSLKHPSPNTVYQVIPLYSDDIPNSNTNPNDDFKKYFDFIIDWTKQASDNGSNVEFRVPNNYIYMPGNISSYNLIHERSESSAQRFTNDLVRAVDSKINFSGSNIALILFPPSTNKIVGDQVGLPRFLTNEGYIVGSIMPSGGNIAPERNFSFPTWWMHELMHVGIGFDDNNHSQKDSPSWWGLINWASTFDLLVWHKWIAGFISDSQVICLDKNKSSTVYIAPSTVKSTRDKLIVIPLSDSRAIVVESQRAEGINYKLPQISEGALVYMVDMSLTNHADGIRLILPKNKNMITTGNMDNKSPGNNSNASLKIGEIAEYNGIRIQVVESGIFGDVIKIEPTR